MISFYPCSLFFFLLPYCSEELGDWQELPRSKGVFQPRNSQWWGLNECWGMGSHAFGLVQFWLLLNSSVAQLSNKIEGNQCCVSHTTFVPLFFAGEIIIPHFVKVLWLSCIKAYESNNKQFTRTTDGNNSLKLISSDVHALCLLPEGGRSNYTFIVMFLCFVQA